MPEQESERLLKLRGAVLAFLICASLMALGTISLLKLPTLIPPVLSTLTVFLSSLICICSAVVVFVRIARRRGATNYLLPTRLPWRAILGLIACLIVVNGTLFYFCHTMTCFTDFVLANMLTPIVWFIGRRVALETISRKA
jgi:hypothetical protein